MDHLFVFGLGYSAKIAAHHFKERGFLISGTNRSTPSDDPIQGDLERHYAFTGEKALPDEALDGVTHILISIPPQDGLGDPTFHHHQALFAKMPHLRWIGYLSSTGVYGDTKGAWVDETSPTQPKTERAKRRVMAENQGLERFKTDALPVHIFRLPGIYGPKRNAVYQVLSGRARRLFKVDQVFSRIHAADIAQTLYASALKPRPGAIYNVVDTLPASNLNPIDLACKLLEKPAPPLMPIDGPDIHPMTRSFFQECRRVRSLYLKSELDVKLHYPTYVEGIEALFASQGL